VPPDSFEGGRSATCTSLFFGSNCPLATRQFVRLCVISGEFSIEGRRPRRFDREMAPVKATAAPDGVAQCYCVPKGAERLAMMTKLCWSATTDEWF